MNTCREADREPAPRPFLLEIEKMENYQKRNNDFMESVRQWQERGKTLTGRPLSMKTAVRKALNGGAPSFYLTRDHVWKKMRERRKGLPPAEKPHRKAMWDEIERALAERQKDAPKETRWESLDYVLNCHSPSGYFITERYAMRLAYKEIKMKKASKRNSQQS